MWKRSNYARIYSRDKLSPMKSVVKYLRVLRRRVAVLLFIEGTVYIGLPAFRVMKSWVLPELR